MYSFTHSLTHPPTHSLIQCLKVFVVHVIQKLYVKINLINSVYFVHSQNVGNRSRNSISVKCVFFSEENNLSKEWIDNKSLWKLFVINIKHKKCTVCKVEILYWWVLVSGNRLTNYNIWIWLSYSDNVCFLVSWKSENFLVDLVL